MKAMGVAEVTAIGVASYFGWQQRAQGDLMLDWSSLPMTMTMGLGAMGLASPQFQAGQNWPPLSERNMPERQ
jgi:hypothetical protein